MVKPSLPTNSIRTRGLRMNKQTNAAKNLKEQVTLEIGPPGQCRVCGYGVDMMKDEFGVGWLEHRIPNTGFVFYVCPNCHTCSGNQFASENAKKIREQGNDGESRIIKPQKSIILPGQN